MNEWEESERRSPSIISSHSHNSSSFVGRLRRKIFSRKGDASVPDGGGLKEKRDFARRQQHVISVEDIAISKELGKGEFGSVYQAAWQNGDEVKQVAVKQIPPERLLANPVCFLQEAAIMTRMCHENVIRLYGVVLDTRSIMLVSELALGSLLQHLQRSGPGEPFPVDVLCDYAMQIAKGMRYLESQRLIHRDLAARNVLLCSPTTVKISDFGLSRSLGVGEDYYRSEFSPSMKLPIAWCAPESINYLRFTPASDVWAFGVTMWEMFTYGKMPWSGYSGAEILNSIDIERKVLHRPESCPFDVYKLMCQCWSYEPERRPTFAELRNRLLPAVMPQLLLTINRVAYPKVKGSRLTYDRDEIIVLLDKCPTRVTGLWLGAIRRTGEVGLFEPRNTVAHLEAEKPSSSYLPPFDASSPSSESANGIDKLSGLSREQKKLLITEPRCDLKHVCHVGTDGSGFGLLNIDKSMLAKSVSPTTISSDCFTVRSLSPHHPLTTTPTPATSTSASASRREITTIHTEQPTNCRQQQQPDNSVPARPPKPGPRSTASVRNHFCPQLITTFNMDVDPPKLPPKPHRSSRVKTPRLDSFPVDVGDISEVVAESADDYLNPMPISPPPTSEIINATSSLNGISFLDSGPSMPDDSTCDESSKPVDSAAELDMVFVELRRDIDEFTLNSQCSDSRPLLESGAKEKRNTWKNGCIPSAADNGEKHQSLIRSMTQDERNKWERRVLSEHKSVDKSLEKEAASMANLLAPHEVDGEVVELAEAMESPRRQIIGFAARLPKILPRSISTDHSSGRCGSSRTARFSSNSASEKTQPTEWTEECMRAYKLMVQSGKLLKSDKLVEGVEQKPHAGRPNQCLPINAIASESNDIELCDQLQYINPSLVEYPE